jgi:hypothetical protein
MIELFISKEFTFIDNIVSITWKLDEYETVYRET